MMRKDWTLLTIVAADEHPLQPVQLQKSLFLISRNLPHHLLGSDQFYSFSPYDYGPFCSDVYADAESLEAEGLIAIQRPPESRFRLYQATEAGARRALALEGKLSPSAVDYVKRVVAFTQSLSFNQLVSTIYKVYPEMRINSVFQE